VKKYAENKEANSQVNKIKELVALGYSDEEIAKRFEIDGEENLAASGTIWSNSDIEKIRFSFNFPQRKETYSPIRIVVFFIVFFVGGIVGLFLAFVCNGGAGGSSQMSASAWDCLLPCLVIYISWFWLLSLRQDGEKNRLRSYI